MSTKQIVFSVLGLLALCALVWFVGPLIAIGGKEWLADDMTRLIVILVIVLLWMANLLRKALSEKSADKQLAEGLTKAEPAAKGKGAAPADGRAMEQELKLRERFQEAVEVLRKSGGKKNGSLYDLPWYVIIGPPGAGKTTALKNSGLKFPLSDRFGTEALRGVGGTRDCDWWFTDEAVLLDTAGRYLTQDSDKAVDSTAWQTFLKLLKRYRRRRPINGVFVAISLAEVLTANEREREAHLRALKQRILELYQVLGLRFPVYLMFTKCDLVAGFTEFYDDLGREEREQVWGVTFDLDERDYGGALAREYDALLGRLNDRLFARLNAERDPHRRGMIYGFPQQMATFKGILASFVDELCRGTRFEDSFLLRGVYFTSGTQEGTPIDRVMGAVARSFGLSAQSMGALSGVGRSYFLTGLLKRVVFPEADVVGVNKRAEKRSAWLRRGAYAACLLALIGSIAAWSNAFNRNQGYVQQINQRIAAWNDIAPQPIEASTPVEEILHRLDVLRDIGRYDEEYRKEHPDTHELGMYQGERLDQAANGAYHRELNRVLVPLLANRIATQLARLGRETDPKYAALKAYVMLAEPSHLDQDFLKAWLDLHWEQDFARSPEVVQRLNDHLDALFAAGVQAGDVDQNLIDETRMALNQTPLAELVYSRLKRDALADAEGALVPAEVLGPLGAKVFSRKSGTPLTEPIPKFFTYDGYYKTFLPESKLLAARARSESWVLANARDELTAGELAKLDQDVTQLYFAEYLATWKGFLNDLRLAQMRSIDHGIEILEALSGRNSALRALLQMIAQNTSLAQAPAGLAEAAGSVTEKVKATKDELAKMLGVGTKGGDAAPAAPATAQVEDAFAEINSVVKPGKDGTLPLDLTLEQLAKLYSELDAVASADPTAPPPKLAESPVNRRMKEIAIGQPEPLKTWLMQLTNNSAEVAGRQAMAEVKKKQSADAQALKTQINDAWTAEVLPFCRKAVMNRYPLKQDSQTDATLRDFGKLFAPGGMIDSFVATNLKPFIDNTGEPWRWRAAQDVDLGASPAVLKQLEAAAKIRDAYFVNGGDQPAVEFAMKALSINGKARQVSFDVGGQQVVFQQGNTQYQSIKWPASSASLDAQISFLEWSGHVFSRRKDGPWALSRLLESAKLEKVTADRLVATFQVDEHTAQFEIRATSVINPLLVDELHNFNCPERF